MISIGSTKERKRNDSENLEETESRELRSDDVKKRLKFEGHIHRTPYIQRASLLSNNSSSRTSLSCRARQEKEKKERAVEGIATIGREECEGVKN